MSEFDVEIKPNYRAMKWRHRWAMLGHYWRLLTNPTYRMLWKIYRGTPK